MAKYIIPSPSVKLEDAIVAFVGSKGPDADFDIDSDSITVEAHDAHTSELENILRGNGVNPTEVQVR